MTPRVEEEMAKLAIKRVLEAVGSVNQLMETNEQIANIGLSVLVELANCLADHFVVTTVRLDGSPTTRDLAKVNVVMMLAAALQLGPSVKEIMKHVMKGKQVG